MDQPVRDEVENVKTVFAKELCKRLVDHYGRMPSAAVVSRDFNFRCPQLSPISQETARRWIRGLSLPEVERLATLVSWLQLDPLQIFRLGKAMPGQYTTGNPLGGESKATSPIPMGGNLNAPQFLSTLEGLDEKAQQLLFMLAKELASRSNQNRS